MNLTPWRKKQEERDAYPMSFPEYVELFNYNNTFYQLSSLTQTLKGNREVINNTFAGLTTQALQNNGSCLPAWKPADPTSQKHGSVSASWSKAAPGI